MHCRAQPQKDPRATSVDYPAFSFNPVFRVYVIEVNGERPIYFLPNQEKLAAIAEFRRGVK